MSAAGDVRRWLPYSLAVALVAFAYLAWAAPSPWPIQPFRKQVLDASLSASLHGAPPLVGEAALAPGVVRAVDPPARGGYLAVTPGDDAGIYVYAPAAARIGGSDDPLDGVRWLYAVLFGLTAGIYPLVFRSLFRSRAAALVAPWALLVGLGETVGFRDIYWILAWPVLTLVPVLMVLARRWPRYGLGLAGVAMLGASFASSIRSWAGLPVLVAGALLVLLQPWLWRRRAAVFGLMLAAYLAITPLAFWGLERYRDGWLGTGFAAQRGHGVWHSAYIGLGYMPNRYGLHYRDLDGVSAGQRSRPGVRYLGGDYEQTMRGAFLDLARRDPGFVVREEADKAVVMLGLGPFAFAALVALAGGLVMCVFSRSRALLRRYVVLVLPAFALGLAPAIAATPDPDYAAGYLGALLLMMLLVVGYGVSVVGTGMRGELLDVRPSWGALTRRGRAVVVATAAAALLVAVSAVAAPEMRARAEAWAASETHAAR